MSVKGAVIIAVQIVTGEVLHYTNCLYLSNISINIATQPHSQEISLFSKSSTWAYNLGIYILIYNAPSSDFSVYESVFPQSSQILLYGIFKKGPLHLVKVIYMIYVLIISGITTGFFGYVPAVCEN